MLQDVGRALDGAKICILLPNGWWRALLLLVKSRRDLLPGRVTKRSPHRATWEKVSANLRIPHAFSLRATQRGALKG